VDTSFIRQHTENDGLTSCEFEGGAALVVTQILSVQTTQFISNKS
jgi:hypothetical protein